VDAQRGALRDMSLVLPGFPALESCHIRFSTGADGSRAFLIIHPSSFYSQKSSLQTLTLRGMNSCIRNRGCMIDLMPAMRHLTIQNLGLTNLKWLTPVCDRDWFTPVRSSPAFPSLRSLKLDDNEDLQLNGAATAALLSMAALTKLSLTRRLAERQGPDDGSDASDAAPPAAAWSTESLRCVAQLAAARPDLKLCF